MKISIIIPLFNQLAYTQQMYESLQVTLPDGLDIEVLFVDDASSDGTPAWLRSISSITPSTKSIKSVRVLTNPINLGYAKSNNRAARESKGDLLLLLNNDLVLKSGWLEPMLEVVNQNQSSPIIIGNLHYLPDTNILDHAGFEVLLDIKSNIPVIEHRRSISSYSAEQVFAVTGACCLISRQTFETVGGFDEEFINGGEDVDLCLKVKEQSGKCWIAPNSKVWHHTSQTRGRNKDRDKKNSARLFQKWSKQISLNLELVCAKILINEKKIDSFVEQIIKEFISGNRNIAPIEVKILAQKIVHTEFKRLSND